MISSPEGIAFARLATLKAALKLEILGLTRHGQSAYSILKKEYGYTGNRQKVYERVCQDVEKAIEGHASDARA